ncbi:MAG: CRISPR-associated endonuclease Cas6 [Saprospiraceae bacterium]
MKTLSEKEVPLHYLRLDAPLQPAEIPRLRRIINTYVGGENDLFHNHISREQYHYRYPVVQYKSVEGKAALLGISDSGCSAIGHLLQHERFLAIFRQEGMNAHLLAEQTTETLDLLERPMYEYRIEDYIALNDRNLADWRYHRGMVFRAQLLERCLVGHCLKFASAIAWQLPPRSLEISLLDYRATNVRSFDINFLAFRIDFLSNMRLPEWIGLGKAVSHGFGSVLPR